MTESMALVLNEMFQEVRSYLRTAGRGAQQIVATNPKGETTLAFDAEAERRAIAVAERHLGSFRLFSEELGATTIGTAPPRWTLVIDPCDGSNNFKRGVRAVGFAVAVLAAESPLAVDHVLYAGVGDVFSDTFYYAERGAGATCAGVPCHTSTVQRLDRAMICVNLGRTGNEAGIGDDADGPPLPSRLWNLLANSSTPRRMGASVLDLAYVADGAYDSYVDLRSRLTPENFLASGLLITEAGGQIVDVSGTSLGVVDFTTPYNIIAAANGALLDQILALLQGEDR